MGGENEKEQKVQEEEKKEENNIQKKPTKKEKDSNESEEDEEEEEEDDSVEDKVNNNKGNKNNNNKGNKNNNNKGDNIDKNKLNRDKKITVRNKDKLKNKKEDKYFSIEESISSKSKNEQKSSNKDRENININNLSELSSYIDERIFHTNSSLNFTIKSSNEKSKSINENNEKNINNNNNDLSEESEYSNYPKIANNAHRKSDNTYFGDFNTLDQDIIYKKRKKKEETEEESETDMSLPLKQRVYNEHNRHKHYLDSNEKGAYAKINKKSFTNTKRYKYRKSVMLHKKEITCLISLSGTIKKIAYSSSSLDKTITLWDAYFLLIGEIKCDEWYSNFICEFDTTNILSCESNHIKMYDLMSEHYDCIRIFKDHIEDIYALLPVIDEEEEKYIFLSGGKDKTLRLWDHEMDAPIKYYEGHYSTVTHIKKYGNDNKKVISCSEDKTFIVWDIKNTNPLKIFNNYFNHLVIENDSLGFCCGAYDNKIRFYNNEYVLIKCLVSQLFGIRNILMINDFCMLIVDIDNNMNILDLDETENNLAFIYTGYEDEVVSVIKSFNWNSKNVGSRAIIVACKNGYAYLYTFEYELTDNNNNNKSTGSKKKKHKTNKKKK